MWRGLRHFRELTSCHRRSNESAPPNLWAQRFDGNLGDLFSIQDQVCAAVAEALHMRLASQSPKRHPSNATAYMQHLKGAYLLKKRRPDDIQRAFEYLQEAIRLEPDYAEPYYGAAMFYIVSTGYGAMSPRTALHEAEELVSKGLALDENSATLQSTLGMLRLFNGAGPTRNRRTSER